MPTYEVKVIGQVVKVFTIDSDKLIDEGNWDEGDDTFNEDIAKVRNEALDNLAIYDGGSGDIINIEDVRVLGGRE